MRTISLVGVLKNVLHGGFDVVDLLFFNLGLFLLNSRRVRRP
jgi:hypothetical protein